MGLSLFGWREAVETEESIEQIRSKFPEKAEQTEDRAYKYFEYRWLGLLKLEFFWEIELVDQKYRVEETVNMSPWWLVVWIISLMASLVQWSIADLIPTNLFLPYVISTFVSLMLSLVLPSLFFNQNSPIEDLFREHGSVGKAGAVASLAIPLYFLYLLGIFFNGFVPWISTLLFAIFFALYLRFEKTVVEYSLWWQTSFMEASRRTPLVTTNYIKFLLLLILPAIAFIIVSQMSFFRFSTASFPLISILIWVVMFSPIYLGAHNIKRKSEKRDKSVFARTGEEIEGSKALFASQFFSVAASLSIGFLLYFFLRRAADLVAVVGNVGAYGLVMVSGISLLYIAGGLTYQVGSFILGNGIRLVNSRSEELGSEVDLAADTRVVETDNLVAGALHTGFGKYILLSERILEELDDSAVDALLAHEEAHLQRRDSLLSTLIAVFSPLVLTGKNILYAGLNFRDRELRADSYAAEKTSEEALDRALEQLVQIGNEDDVDGVTGGGPTMVSFGSKGRSRSLLQRLFGFHYGSFAMTDAHASIEERRQQLDFCALHRPV